MQEVQDENQAASGQEDAPEDVMQSQGDQEQSEDNSEGSKKDSQDELPAFAKERLGRQEKRHKKELRDLRQQMQMLMQSQQGGSQGYAPTQSPQDAGMGGQDDQIQRAVQAALQAKDMQAKQMEEAEKAAHVHKQYQNLEEHLDSAADKYDDFDEVVRGNDVPFTPAMRDASLLLDNPGDVLYKLGKNRDELKRISRLHPLDQAKEMVKLSVALMNPVSRSSNAPKTMGQIKSTPVNPQYVNDQTPVGDIRARMKSGTWK
jgi:hypothetical protein